MFVCFILLVQMEPQIATKVCCRDLKGFERWSSDVTNSLDPACLGTDGFTLRQLSSLGHGSRMILKGRALWEWMWDFTRRFGWVFLETSPRLMTPFEARQDQFGT